jgi:hypothetical protein
MAIKKEEREKRKEKRGAALRSALFPVSSSEVSE